MEKYGQLKKDAESCLETGTMICFDASRLLEILGEHSKLLKALRNLTIHNGPFQLVDAFDAIREAEAKS